MLDARGAAIRHIFKLVSAMLLVCNLKSLTVQFFNQLHRRNIPHSHVICMDQNDYCISKYTLPHFITLYHSELLKYLYKKYLNFVGKVW